MPETQYLIAVVDDEKNILLSIESCLSSPTMQIHSYANASDAFIGLQRHMYDCALIDIRLGESSGIALYQKLRASDVTTPVIFMSGNASLDEAAKSQQLGAFDFIEKPFSAEKLNLTLSNCLKFHELENELSSLQAAKTDQALIGEHPVMVQLKQDIVKIAKTSAAVLIQGESGTGKELIASAIHQASQRSAGQLVRVNCSAIPDNLVESALFGHTKGSFTGATESKKGYFEVAHKGTLFLDEIGDMPLNAQTSLLRVLESGEIQKVGSDTTTKIDVRVIAATHKDLNAAVTDGTFRQDLYYRLNVLPIESPALRERLNDLPILVKHLLHKLCVRHALPQKSIDTECVVEFMNYPWPGNVRELNNTLERMVIMGGEKLSLNDIPKDIKLNSGDQSLDISLKDYRANTERKLILQRLKHYQGNVSQVARSLGIDRTNLHKKMNALGIERENDFN